MICWLALSSPFLKPSEVCTDLEPHCKDPHLPPG